jgi:MazG family protein
MFGLCSYSLILVHQSIVWKLVTLRAVKRKSSVRNVDLSTVGAGPSGQQAAADMRTRTPSPCSAKALLHPKSKSWAGTNSKLPHYRAVAFIAHTCPSRLQCLGLMPTTGERFERAVAIMARLRGPGGCPWDREQTFDSIKPYTLEETYEVLEAIDNRDWDELPGELGDLLLQVLFYAQMAKDQGTFSIDEVLDRLSSKLVDRHPHVFGDVKAETSSEVLRNWQALKVEEKKKKKNAAGENEKDSTASESVLAGVSTAMPSLIEAYKLSSRAAQVGFDWPNIEGLFEKLQEETAELKQGLEEFPAPGPRPHGRGVAGAGTQQVPEALRQHLEEEVGDLFFVLVNIARYLSLDPESALRKTNRKFKQRFQWMETELRASGRGPEKASVTELESLWQQAKIHLKQGQPDREREAG